MNDKQFKYFMILVALMCKDMVVYLIHNTVTSSEWSKVFWNYANEFDRLLEEAIANGDEEVLKAVSFDKTGKENEIN